MISRDPHLVLASCSCDRNTSKFVTMATKKVKTLVIEMPPGPRALTEFFREHSAMLNLAEIERQCNFPPATLRHIRTSGRTINSEQYEVIKKCISPFLLQFSMILTYCPITTKHW